MSALSFVALSLQTTHLDPATVCKASYIKLVDGNITRLDAIPIIPPGTEPEDSSDNPQEATTWDDALAQLRMMVGKLPVVSYYRDADKEIFQAASRRTGVTPPTFQWLDCRALARELLPDLPEYQLSTVLKALDLYNDHADSSTVEQTAHIVLQLAERQGATTVSQLWGELYDQPDELLDLEATLEGLSSPETSDEGIDDAEGTPAAPSAIGSAVPVVAAISESGSPSTAASSSVSTAQDEPEEESSVEAAGSDALNDEPADEADEIPEDEEPVEPQEIPEEGLADEAEPHTTPLEAGHEPSAEATESADNTDTVLPETETEAEDETLDDVGDSTAQSVIESENLEQPEFLKVPIHDEPAEEDLHRYDHEQTSSESEHLDDETVKEESTEAPANLEEQPTEPIDTELLNATEQSDEEPPAQTAPIETIRPLEESHAEEARAPEPSKDPELTPATEQTSAVATTQYVEVPPAQQRASEEKTPSPFTAARIFGLLGMIVFGVLTVVGLVLTVMATLLFFTSNNLLLETKIAGVVLTGAVTLLSLLMTSLSYRSFRRK